MNKNIFYTILLIFFFNFVFAQTEKRNFAYFSISIVPISSNLSKTDYGETKKDETYTTINFDYAIHYDRYYSKYLTLSSQLKFLTFNRNRNFSFTFDNNGQTIITGYNANLNIKEYSLNIAGELNPGFWSRFYVKLGTGIGLCTVKNIVASPNKTIYGLDGDYLRVKKLSPLKSTNPYFSYFAGFGFYLLRSEVFIKTGYNFIHNQKTDIKFENLELQNNESEIYLQFGYQF